MVPVQDMSLKLNDSIEISPTSVKNGSPIKLTEEMMVCVSDGKDYVFDSATVNLPQEKTVVNCVSSCQGNTSNMKTCAGGHECAIQATRGNNEDVEVNVVDDVNPIEERVVGTDSQDVTECSSSFASTDSGDEKAVMLGDVIVESQMREDNSLLLGFNDFSGLLGTRKKKLMPDWRNFIRPLMWRCKWVEMRIRELHSQASKYEKELAECKRKKQSELEKYAMQDHARNSVPFCCQNQAMKLLKRNRRKRVEETVDLASYTSSHSLFSYYAKRRCVDGFVSVDDEDLVKVVPAEETSFDDDLFGVKGGWPTLDFEHSDAFESIFRKIEEAQSQVRKLRARLDKVVTENAGKFTSDDSSIPPCNQLASCVPNPISCNVDGEYINAIPQQTDGEKLLKLEVVVGNSGEGASLPTMIENPGHAKRFEYMENETLTYGQPVKQELHNTEEVGVERIADPSTARSDKAGNSQDPNSPGKALILSEQQSVKGQAAFKLATPKNKRKRGRRKARLGMWNRRSSG